MNLVRHFFSTRPEDHADRKACVEFAADIDRSKASAVVVAILVATYDPVTKVYTAAVAANGTAATNVINASDVVTATATGLELALLSWMTAIDTAAKKRGFAQDELYPYFGRKTLLAFLERAPWDKLHDLELLFLHVADTPALVGSDVALQAAKDATTAYQEAVRTHEEALKTRNDTVEALKIASTAFDRSWGVVVKDLKFHDPEGLGAHVPKFRRTEPIKSTKAPPPDDEQGQGKDEEPPAEEPPAEEPPADPAPEPPPADAAPPEPTPPAPTPPAPVVPAK
jgi:hypothetical protein